MVSGYEAKMYRDIGCINTTLKEISTTLSSYSVEWFSISNSLKRIATALEKQNEPCENNYWVKNDGSIVEIDKPKEDYNATYEREEMS